MTWVPTPMCEEAGCGSEMTDLVHAPPRGLDEEVRVDDGRILGRCDGVIFPTSSHQHPGLSARHERVHSRPHPPPLAVWPLGQDR